MRELNQELLKICKTIRFLSFDIDNICCQRDELSQDDYFPQYLELCGKDRRSYFFDYLNCLQPYMIYEYGTLGELTWAKCRVDGFTHRISRYVEVSYNSCGEGKLNVHMGVEESGEPEAVKRTKDMLLYADYCTSYVKAKEYNAMNIAPIQDDIYGLHILYMLGLSKIAMNVCGTKEGEAFLVRTSNIKMSISDVNSSYTNMTYEEIDVEDLDTEINVVVSSAWEYEESEDELERIRLMEEELRLDNMTTVYSKLSSLVDSLLRTNFKRALDGAIVRYLYEIYLTEEQKDTLMRFLEKKYGDKGPEYRLVIERIREYA